MSEIAALIIRRGTLKGQLTRFNKYVHDNKNLDIEQLIFRKERVKEIWNDFEQIQAQIEEEKGDIEENEFYRIEFEELYFSSMAECERLLKNASTNLNRIEDLQSTEKGSRFPTLPSNNQYLSPSIKLAALQIPTFSGNYTEWSSYFDIFTALVHNNDSLSDIQKFFYLRSSLSGDAEKSIQCMQTTSDNYQKAWSSLIERYNNKRILIQVHTKSLFNILPIKEESSEQLRKLYDSLSGHIKALETLGESPNRWGSLLLYLITTKLDSTTLRQWKIESNKLVEISAEHLLEYLESRFRILEAVESTSTKPVPNSKANKDQFREYKKNVYKGTSFVTTGEIKCYNCKQSHTIYKCPSFLKLSIIDRIKRTTELNLCKICLRLHDGVKCNSRRCPKCSRPHNGLLHIVSRNESSDKTTYSSVSESTINKQENDKETNTETTTSMFAHTSRQNVNNQVLLSTAVVLAFNNSNETVLCRVLLDSGSQNNFITESMVKYLQLKRKRIAYSIIGINQSKLSASYQVSAKIKSRLHNYETYLDFVVMPKLTSYLPSMPINLTEVDIPERIELADPSFNSPNKIDMIIGSEIFFEILCADQLKPTLHGPIFQKTFFGWIVAGPVSDTTERVCRENKCISLYSSTNSSFASLEKQVAKFWRLEEIQCKVYSLEEKACKNHFEKTLTRAADGKFIVSLPFRDALKLGKSYEIALRRFLSLERRLQAQNKLKVEYKKFIDEYLALGHMEIVASEEPSVYMKHNYLPHHAVIKENSSTTKVRVVFDASCKTDTGVSLNDVLCKGPSIQEDLVCIMARFRTYKYVISADIVKMYRQIWVTDHHRDFQRILWRSSPDQPIQIYRLKTITYGVITASFLATGCLQKLAEYEYDQYTYACKMIRENFYMDDLLCGADTIENTLKLRDDIITVLNTAGFELRKWCSNTSELLHGVPKLEIINVENDLINNVKEKCTKILGLVWNQKTDSYQYIVKAYSDNTRITKRNVLSEIASVFDPLGLISPVIVRLKLLMQKLWQLNIKWDESLPSEICDDWQKTRKDLGIINTLVIDRLITSSKKISNLQIHGFADASLSAYGACLYIRTSNENGDVTIKLICAKSRVSPLKVVTLPRLELLASVLLARLGAKYIPSLQLCVDEIYYWTDSTIVLAWISSPASKWKTFVGHRVSEIQELSAISQWRHVNSKDNPADIVSRGCSPSQIIDSCLWWYGPEWLRSEESEWPKTNLEFKNGTSIPEEKTTSKIAMVTTRDVSILSRYSSLSKLLRVIAYCLRFRVNANPKADKISGFVQREEIEKATIIAVKLVQSVAWVTELSCLKNSRKINNNSPLLRLKPFIDENGIIRVGGRLKHADTIDIFQKHPILLPANSPFTHLIFLNEHEISLHGGPQLMLARIRLQYWPLNGRNIARGIVRRCVKCFKYKPVVVQPIMGDLPKNRITPARPFLKCGVDFAGPVYVKSSLRRKAPTCKAYICLWVCFVTKAVHVELVGDLTTEAFLNALNRFFDRRGICSDIYSDNATNFVGANRQLKELNELFLSVNHREKMENMLAKFGVRWHFIPPGSPHFGGLWEAAIKSVKSHLYKVLGNALLTYEELYTVLVRVEAILNSRPLTPLSSDPTDLAVLTPSHFLIGDNLSALPDRDVSNTPSNRLTRWRRVTQITQQLWRHWNLQYLTQLQIREKWSHSKGPSLAIGTVVLIRDDNLPPLSWKIGRVTETHEDTDGVIRVATVRTSNGHYKRAVRQLCPLPFEGNESSS